MLSHKMKANLYKACVRIVMLCGSETWLHPTVNVNTSRALMPL